MVTDAQTGIGSLVDKAASTPGSCGTLVCGFLIVPQANEVQFPLAHRYHAFLPGRSRLENSTAYGTLPALSFCFGWRAGRLLGADWVGVLYLSHRRLADGEGTHAEGGHNFLEVMSHIDDTEDILPYDGKPTTLNGVYHLDSLDHPDIYEAWKFLFAYAPTNFQLNRFFVNNAGTWHETVAQIRQVFELAHTDLKASGDLWKITSEEKILRDCIDETIKLRQSDMTINLAKDILKEDGWNNAVVKTVLEKWHYEATVPLYSIDFPTTVQQSAGVFTLDEVKAFGRAYGTRRTDSGPAKRHRQVLDQHRAHFSSVMDRLSGKC
ncbi:uncharacterized protein B0I36DRAFT_349765 [Microdochium trichocladiopsis]|uniref:Uncharacterized protein n=1 Tax=Microdochium trichocladiopsis TaxID=1682393 RepID=A0A9P9BP75_9PEZI|nr:uncharacterized protein B0I36DRAFT_349765 [Microdochium trichocladiopsis]KAH7028765.1 hypothetical protein B0I36DRAFT_349765 [Microdochium trichocladiopsis]